MASDDANDEYRKPPSKIPTVVAAAVALLVGAGAGYGGSALTGGPAEAEAGEQAGVAEPVEPENTIVTLGKFTLNLRGAAGGRILRFQVDVEIRSADEARIERDMAILRDGAILLASDYSFADVDGLDGKLRLRDELLGRLNTLLGEPAIRRVFFTEFVVQ